MPGAAQQGVEMATEAIPVPVTKARSASQTARLVLAAFLLTFICARIIVFLIMSRRIPDLYAHVKGTHVHHLNYGIFLLSFVGGYLLFRKPTGAELTLATVLYGIGMGLTFDEFGMWLHLGGPYWQRASFDAIVVIAAIFGLIGFAPSFRAFRPKTWIATAVLAASVLIFAYFLVESFQYAGREWGPAIHRMEADAPQ